MCLKPYRRFTIILSRYLKEKTHMFGTMSEEQRQKAQLVRKEKREKGLSTYKTDWLDDSHWAELAREANIKLPQHHVAPSGIRLDKIAKQHTWTIRLLRSALSLWTMSVGLLSGCLKKRLRW